MADELSPAAFESIWGDAQAIPPEEIGGKFSVSKLGNVLTLLFDALFCNLDGPDAPLSRSMAVTVRAPLAVGDDERFIGFLQQLRGSADLTPGGRVLIVATAGGRAEVMEFANDNDGNDPVESLRSESFFRSLFTLVERSPKTEDAAGFFPVPPFEVTLLLHAHRRTVQDVASIAIDSLDIEAVRHNPSAK
jgi:hypothetical protein